MPPATNRSADQVSIPEVLPLLPIDNTVLFRAMLLPLAVSGDRWVKLVDDAALGNKLIGAFWRTHAGESFDALALARTGTAAQIVRMLRLPDGGIQLLLQGQARIQIEQLLATEPYPTARVRRLQAPQEASLELEGLARSALTAFQQVVQLNPSLPDELAVLAANMPTPGRLADLITANLNLRPEDQQAVLDALDPAARLRLVLGYLEREREILAIGQRTREELSKNQREYVLRQQLEQIRRELGESDERGAEIAELRSRLELEGAGKSPITATDVPASNRPPSSVLRPSSIAELTNEALRRLIREYTHEAGVRDLERRIGAIYRKIATRMVEGQPLSERIDGSELDELLGPPRFRSETLLGEDEVGVVTGLAWTPAGGDVLFVEAIAVPGNGQLILTGQLGDVMRESARAALTYTRARAEMLGIPADFAQKRDIHIHVPAGAVPKDGPSAGITMASALVSALTDRPAYKHVVMTGEITLSGKVLPIGGLKEKLLAAQRAGVTKVLLPRDNAPDLRDVPEETRS
jgi:ATP-dependent Lon protease